MREHRCYGKVAVRLYFDDAVKVFLEDARARNLSRASLVWYRSTLHNLSVFLGPDTDVTCVGSAQLRAFLAYRLERGSPRGANAYHRAVRALFRWCVAEGILAADPMARVKAARVPRYVPTILSPEEVGALLSVWSGSGYIEARNRACVLLLLDTGLRVAELCSLTVGSLDLSSGLLQVMGKGRRERQVPMSMPLRQELRRFLRVREAKRIPSTFLFASSLGGPWGTASVEQTLRKVARKAGLDPVRIRPHNFRRTAATTLLRQGASLEHVRVILGHADIATTSRYLGLDVSDLKAVHTQASPLVAFGLGNTRRF